MKAPSITPKLMAKPLCENVDKGIASDVKVGAKDHHLDIGEHIADEAKFNGEACRDRLAWTKLS